MSIPHLETIHLEHTPSTLNVHVALYRNVKNAGFLHQQLLAGNTEFEYAFVDAGVVSYLSLGGRNAIGVDACVLAFLSNFHGAS